MENSPLILQVLIVANQLNPTDIQAIQQLNYSKSIVLQAKLIFVTAKIPDCFYLLPEIFHTELQLHNRAKWWLDQLSDELAIAKDVHYLQVGTLKHEVLKLAKMFNVDMILSSHIESLEAPMMGKLTIPIVTPVDFLAQVAGFLEQRETDVNRYPGVQRNSSGLSLQQWLKKKERLSAYEI